MGLYGIYGKHTQEACPLYNDESRKYLLGVAPTMEQVTEKLTVTIVHQFHSALDHTFLLIAEADNPHIIEELMARRGGRFNTLKIVPLITFQTLLERCKKVEEGSFFPENVE